jgi:hypothetical protein
MRRPRREYPCARVDLSHWASRRPWRKTTPPGETDRHGRRRAPQTNRRAMHPHPGRGIDAKPRAGFGRFVTAQTMSDANTAAHKPMVNHMPRPDPETPAHRSERAALSERRRRTCPGPSPSARARMIVRPKSVSRPAFRPVSGRTIKHRRDVYPKRSLCPARHALSGQRSQREPTRSKHAQPERRTHPRKPQQADDEHAHPRPEPEAPPEANGVSTTSQRRPRPRRRRRTKPQPTADGEPAGAYGPQPTRTRANLLERCQLYLALSYDQSIVPRTAYSTPSR